jgi:hypothetical protein
VVRERPHPGGLGPEVTVGRRRAIRVAAAPPSAVAERCAALPARRARTEAARLPAGHARPRAAVPRDLLVRPGVAAGRLPLTGPAGAQRQAASTRPMTPHAGPVGRPRAQPRVTMRGPHPATARAGPPGRPQAPVSAPRPRRQGLDREEPLRGSTASQGSAARRLTVPNAAMTGPPPATSHGGPTVRTVPPVVTVAAGRTVRTVPLVVTVAAGRTVTPNRGLRTVRRVSALEAVVRAREAGTRPATVASGPILRPGRPAGGARRAHPRGRAAAAPGMDLRDARRAVIAAPRRPATVTAIGAHGKEGRPGFPQPAARRAAFSRERMPRAFLTRSALSSSIPRHGPS